MFTQLLVILENRDILLMIQCHNYADSNDNNNDNDSDVTVIWR